MSCGSVQVSCLCFVITPHLVGFSGAFYFEVPILNALLWSLRKSEVAQISMIQHQVLFNMLRLSSTSTDVTQKCRLAVEMGTFPRQCEHTKKSQLTASAPCCTCSAQDTGEMFHNVEISLSLLLP